MLAERAVFLLQFLIATKADVKEAPQKFQPCRNSHAKGECLATWGRTNCSACTWHLAYISVWCTTTTLRDMNIVRAPLVTSLGPSHGKRVSHQAEDSLAIKGLNMHALFHGSYLPPTALLQSKGCFLDVCVSVHGIRGLSCLPFIELFYMVNM